MKNNKMKLTTKYLKTGGYSVLVSCVAIAIIIVINLFVNQLPTSVTQIDMSSSDILSITDETVELVKGIKDDITVYYVSQHGNEDTYISTILDKYKDLNDKIKFEQVDPALNPAFFTGDRQNMTEGSLFVESEKRSKIITYFEIYYPGYTETDIYNYYQQSGTMPGATGFDLENCMTTAINYVTTDVLPVIYMLQGHGELALSDTYSKYLTSESMEVRELSLATLEAVPEDCDCLFINVPEKDISADEAERILTYLKSGGKMMYVSYYAYAIEEEKTNLNTVLEYYGLKSGEGLIIEGNSGAHYPGNPSIIVPLYGEHEITAPLSGYYMFSVNNQGIEINEDLRDTLTVTPLLYTTDGAYAKVNLQSETLEKEEGDIVGPFNLAVAVSEENEDGTQTGIVWINNPSTITESIDIYGTWGAMFVNSFGWMCEKEEAISIPVKHFEQNYLELTEVQGTALTVVFAIVLPLAVVVTGFVVWFRRRRK